MEAQEINEGNKLIAEFVGSKPVYTDHSEYNDDGTMKYDFNGDGSPRIIETWTKPDWFTDKHLNTYGWGSYNMLQNMLYYSSWDWLMSVIEKIENLEVNGREDNKEYVQHFTVEISNEQCVIHRYFAPQYWGTELDFLGLYDHNNTSKMDSTFASVVEFIKWYNSCKK